MKKGFFIKTIVIFTLLAGCLAPLTGQQTLSNLNTSWTNVLPGSVITEPTVTSYGFCLITDARMLSAFTNEGKLLWEKPVNRSRKIILSDLPADFIALIDNSGKTLKVLNPSGGEIWTKKLDYTVTQKPFSGRDGRFFIKGDSVLECYGMNGVCKWRLETEKQKNMQIQELPDGSLILFLIEVTGKTRGLRISPFGEMLEDILFAGEITNAFTCSDGVLLTFTDGSGGLFTVSQNAAVNKWTASQKMKSPYFAVSSDRSEYLFLDLQADGVSVSQIDKSNGAITHSIKVSGINGSGLQKISYNSAGLFLCDKKNASLYNASGNELWSAKVPYDKSKDLWNYVVYTQDSYLIFCYKNWTLNAYHVAQTKTATAVKTFELDYSQWIEVSSNNFSVLYDQSFNNELIKTERLTSLQNGLYSTAEIQWASELLSICQMYNEELRRSDFGTRKEKSIFELDSPGFEKILKQLLLLGNADAQNCAADIILKTPNRSYLKAIFNGITVNGYDPDGSLLNSLELRAKSLNYKDKTIINDVCDAVYSICVFMGRPAYNTKGKDILKSFMFPSYDAKTREYARETLKKIIALEL